MLTLATETFTLARMRSTIPGNVATGSVARVQLVRAYSSMGAQQHTRTARTTALHGMPLTQSVTQVLQKSELAHALQLPTSIPTTRRRPGHLIRLRVKKLASASLELDVQDLTHGWDACYIS